MRFKVVILGTSGVGKSSLLYRFVKKQVLPNPESTCGTCFQTVQRGNIQLNIWDTAGQERYQSLIPFYTRGASVYLVVYDVTDAKTKKYATDWCKKISEEYRPSPEMPEQPIICLIGNKSDLLHVEAEGYLTNVFDDSIEQVFDDIYTQLEKCKVEEMKEVVLIDDKPPSRLRCCFI